MLTKNYLRDMIRTHVTVFLNQWSDKPGPKLSSTSTEFKDQLADLVYGLDYGLKNKSFSLGKMKTDFRKLDITINQIDCMVKRIMKMEFIREILFARKLQDFGIYRVVCEKRKVLKVDMQGFLDRRTLEWSVADERSRPLVKAGMIEHLLHHELPYIIHQENRVAKRGQLGKIEPTSTTNGFYVYGRLVEFNVTTGNTIMFKMHKQVVFPRIKSKRKQTFIRQYENDEVFVIFRDILSKIGMFTNVAQIGSQNGYYNLQVSFSNTFLTDTQVGTIGKTDATALTVYDPLTVKIANLTNEIETKRNQLLKAEELAVRHKASLEDMQNDLIILKKAQKIVTK